MTAFLQSGKGQAAWLVQLLTAGVLVIQAVSPGCISNQLTWKPAKVNGILTSIMHNLVSLEGNDWFSIISCMTKTLTDAKKTSVDGQCCLLKCWPSCQAPFRLLLAASARGSLNPEGSSTPVIKLPLGLAIGRACQTLPSGELDPQPGHKPSSPWLELYSPQF